MSVRVQREAARADGRVVLVVQATSTGVTLGSYQGSVHFDPRAFVVDSVSAGSDGYRLANGQDAARGIVRFAGFTTDGFHSTEAVRIVGVSHGLLNRAGFRAVLDVAGDLAGNKISPKYLHSGTGVDETAQRPTNVRR